MDPDYRSRWSWIWTAWLIAVAVSFAVLEGIGLINRKPGDTLSENTRHWLGVDRGWKSAGPIGFIVALVAFVVWFVPHIVWEVW
ncbi:hypothetical protein [Micromonospora sp. NBC_01813]|uniref:hypothetical protein n=1 Tax=Micromonospora sp. NBC_01813 TaxID=2975988 RepID=UPI002DDAE3D7|nr:hypothetical protein [Micromonospora sp. NBC_01813]WSA11540.1 hypothetical protein OG958_12590 [Micromonospora sp. NBC_01813]